MTVNFSVKRCYFAAQTLEKLHSNGAGYAVAAVDGDFDGASKFHIVGDFLQVRSHNVNFFNGAFLLGDSNACLNTMTQVLNAITV